MSHHHHHGDYHHHTDDYSAHSHDGDLRNVKSNSKSLLISVILNFSISLVQIVGGIVSGSLALVSDSLHNLSDSISIFLSYLAGRVSERKSDLRRTYGYKRVEILTAFFNSLTLIAICLFMLYEAIQRYLAPKQIDTTTMIIVATFGLIANVFSVILLFKGKDSNLNIKSAYLHLLGDSISSVAVIVGGIVIYYTQFFVIDIILTILISAFLIKESYRVTIETVDILLQSVPPNISIEKVRQELEEIENVKSVHHIHIWGLNEKRIFFEGHVEMESDMLLSEISETNQNIRDFLRDNYNISHFTIQTEYLSEDCQDC